MEVLETGSQAAVEIETSPVLSVHCPACSNNQLDIHGSGILTKPLWLHYRVYSGFERARVFHHHDVMFK